MLNSIKICITNILNISFVYKETIILPVFFLTGVKPGLSHERKNTFLWALWNRVLRKILGPKSVEIIAARRKLCKDSFVICNFVIC